MFHVTPRENLAGIVASGLEPRIGARSALLGEEAPAVYLFRSLGDVEQALMGWLGDEFEDTEVCVLELDLAGLELLDDPDMFEVTSDIPIPPARIVRAFNENLIAIRVPGVAGVNPTPDQTKTPSSMTKDLSKMKPLNDGLGAIIRSLDGIARSGREVDGLQRTLDILRRLDPELADDRGLGAYKHPVDFVTAAEAGALAKNLREAAAKVIGPRSVGQALTEAADRLTLVASHVTAAKTTAPIIATAAINRARKFGR